MKIGEEDFGLVCGKSEPCEGLTKKLKEYSAAKLREAEKREQEMLEKPFYIELLLQRIKRKFR